MRFAYQVDCVQVWQCGSSEGATGEGAGGGSVVLLFQFTAVVVAVVARRTTNKKILNIQKTPALPTQPNHQTSKPNQQPGKRYVRKDILSNVRFIEAHMDRIISFPMKRKGKVVKLTGEGVGGHKTDAPFDVGRPTPPLFGEMTSLTKPTFI